MPPLPHRHRTTVVLAAALGACALQAVPASASPQTDERADRQTDQQTDDQQTDQQAGRQASRQSLDQRGTAARTPAAAAPAPRATVTLAAPVRSAGQTTYRVRRGDTVSHIAVRLGVPQAGLVAANGLDSRAFIREGQVLVVPAGGASAPTAAPAAAASYVVRRGDTLGHIARRTGTTVAALTSANGLDARGFIREGQKLSVPGSAASVPRASASASAAPAAGTSHTVRSGDTLSHIAARAGVTLAQLRAVNPGTGDRLQIGQRISLPAAAGSGTVGSTFAGRTYPAATVAAAQANKDSLHARSVPTRAQMRTMVASTARAQGVDPALALAIAHQESGFDMRAVSPANAIGVMQVIPSSGVWASELAGRRLDLLSPQDNVLAGVLVLRANLRAADDQATGIAAYYQGLSSVKRNGMYADTRRYVANVQTLAAGFG